MNAPRLQVLALRGGTRFVHASWLDGANAPLECVVTRVALGVVYWRPADGGAPMTFRADEAARYVRRIIIPVAPPPIR